MLGINIGVSPRPAPSVLFGYLVEKFQLHCFVPGLTALPSVRYA